MNATTNNSPLIEKIAKLLRLSASPNQHEAELALSKAKQIAVENDIDLASVNHSQEEDTYDEGGITLGKRKPVTGRFVSWIIQNHFNVHIIYSGSRWEGQRVNFVGKTKDIQVATYVFHYLNQTFMSLWHKYKKVSDCSARSRGSYFYGLYQGLNQKLTQAKDEAEKNKFAALEKEKGAEASADIKNQYSLMVVNNQDKLQSAVKKFYPRLTSAGTYRINLSNDGALRQGREDGSRIDIRPSIGNASHSGLVTA